MIESKLATAQAKRLSGLPGYPDNREAQTELALALQCFKTDSSARAFVDDWIAHQQFAPLPAAIRRAAYDLAERENQDWLEAKKCPACSGSGYRMEVRMQRALPGMALARYDYAVKCNHAEAA